MLFKRAIRQFSNLPAKNNGDVDAIIHQIYTYDNRTKHPPKVDESKGWSPYLACSFLKEVGLQTNDFHKGADDNGWWAETPYLDLDDHGFSNTAVFYLEGDEEIVTLLKLKGHFTDEYLSEVSLETFRSICIALAAAGLNIEQEEALLLIPKKDEFTLQNRDTLIKSSIERYPSGTGFEYYFRLSRGGVSVHLCMYKFQVNLHLTQRLLHPPLAKRKKLLVSR